MLDDSPYWTKQRRELVRWLDDHAPSFTESYIGAVHLLHARSFPGREHLICHIVRDIYRRLPVTRGERSLSRAAEIYPDMVKTLADRWVRFPPKGTARSEAVGTDIPVSPQVYNAIRKLVDKSKELKNQPTVGGQLAIVLFHSLDRRSDEFIHPWIIRSFDEEYDFFKERAHLAETLDKVPTDDGLVGHFEGFERAFHSLVGPYFSGKEELDAILQETNATTD